MLLTVNIGNSSIRFGLFENNNHHHLECDRSWIINTNPHRSLDEYIFLFKSIYHQNGILSQLIKNIVIGSVVPSLTNIVELSLYKIHKKKPIVVDRYSISPVKHFSHQLGTDLYANAIAAYTLYHKKKKKALLVIDFGTALSFTCIDKNGLIQGVVIAPGVKNSLFSLIGNTALLSQVELKKPSNILGKYTETCIQSGIIYGYLSMVEGLINRINKELKKNCFVIATGGLSHIYSPLTNSIHYEDKLHTIKGLKILFYWNNK